MKRTVLFTCLVLVMSSCFALLHAAEIYWDGMVADEEITDEDFKHNYGESRTTKSLGDLGIYDNNMVINVEGPDDAPDADYEAPAPAPIEPRSVQPPAAPGPAPRAVQTPSEPRVAPRQRDAAPQAVEREPSGGTNIMRRLERAPKPQPQSVESQPASSPPASTEQPATGEKKMKWGQQESSSSDTQGKFQWGQRQ
jgi:hypothetical protein